MVWFVQLIFGHFDYLEFLKDSQIRLDVFTYIVVFMTGCNICLKRYEMISRLLLNVRGSGTFSSIVVLLY